MECSSIPYFFWKVKSKSLEKVVSLYCETRRKFIFLLKHCEIYNEVWLITAVSSFVCMDCRYLGEKRSNCPTYDRQNLLLLFLSLFQGLACIR